MIRCTKLAVAVLALAVAATPASAQNLSAFVTAGASIPVGDFADDANTGWIAGAGVLVPVGQAGLWVGGEGFYGRHGVDFPGVDESWTLTGAGALIGYTVNPLAQLSPFVFGSLGFLSFGATASGFSSESGLAFGAGGGVSYTLTPSLSVFGAARFINGRIKFEDETDNVQFIPITLGLNFRLGGN
jgi:hypothetical protein